MFKEHTLQQRDIERDAAREQRQARKAGRAFVAPQRQSPPQTRGDCIGAPRPCPFVACRHHLFVEVTSTGSIQFPYGDDVSVLRDMAETCSLDVADRGGHHPAYLAQLMNLIRFSVDRRVAAALQVMRRRLNAPPRDLTSLEP